MARELKSPVTPEEIRNGELYGVLLKAAGEGAALDNGVIKQKLAVAEDYVERELQLRFRPTRVFGDGYSRIRAPHKIGPLALFEKDTDHPDGFDRIKDITEPAYDYANDFWSEEKWGKLWLNYRPIRDISQFVFGFPGNIPVFKPPITWLRPDDKFGEVQLVPSTAEAVYVSFSAFMLGTLAGGRGLPQSIYVDYEVGFTPEELRANHEDLLELVRNLATLSILGIAQLAVSPGGSNSNSLGLDGLSRSMSWGGKWGPYSGRIELLRDRIATITDTWKRREKGIPMMFV